MVCASINSQNHELVSTGNQDLCYYNFLCANPVHNSVFKVSDFNHIFSNIHYILFGLLFLLIVWQRRKQHRLFEVKSCSNMKLSSIHTYYVPGKTQKKWNNNKIWPATTLRDVLCDGHCIDIRRVPLGHIPHLPYGPKLSVWHCLHVHSFNSDDKQDIPIQGNNQELLLEFWTYRRNNEMYSYHLTCH